MPRPRTQADEPETILKSPVLPVRDNVHFPMIVTTLLVGRDISMKALQAASQSDRTVVVLGQNDIGVDEPMASDLYRVGTVSEIVQVLPMPDGTMRIVLRGLSRVRVQKIASRRGYLHAEYLPLHEVEVGHEDTEAYRREALELCSQIAELNSMVSPEISELLPAIDGAGHLADTIANHLTLKPTVKQQILEILDGRDRLEQIVSILAGELQVLKVQSQIRTRVERELGNTQREYFLREQLRAIQDELDGPDSLSPEGRELATRIDAANMPPEVHEKAYAELKRLERAPGSSPESFVIRTYIEWLTELPWQELTPDTLDIKHAAKILDRDHFGLAKVKDRILDYLAVRQVSQSLRGPILCFVGPPGVGKTSLGRSIAEATGRKFVQISLGGVRDEAEIRGHRRTYIGSLPGRLIQSLKTCGTSNPVCLLDEVDKMSRDLRGDPTSALLEALDPEQNNAFVDHYVEVPFDLSGVMFILTANVIENIPPALRDRMEIIDFSSYTEDEKMHIARTYLIPKKREEHGLRPDQFSVQEDALTQLIRGYTRESGVRNLEREIATLCRKATRRIAEQVDASVTIGHKELLAFLGRQKFHHDKAEEKDQVGAATGLVYTEFGGDIVTIEANLMARKGPTSDLTLTGCLGQVMKESAQAATTYVRSQEEKLAPGQPFDFDVHIHVPEGAVPKDGPSAGVTMVTALASAYTGRAVRRDVAMTGEVTLRGVVLPVGGLREKVLAAHRAGIKEVIVPQQNRPDLDDVPAGVLAELKLHFVQSVEEVIDIALTK